MRPPRPEASAGAARTRRSPSSARSRARSGASARAPTPSPRELRGMGLEVDEDDAPPSRRGLREPARPHPGPRRTRPILLCAHLDTVAHDGADRAGGRRRRAGINRHDGILGADNKAAVAVLLERRAPGRGRGLAGRPRAPVHGRRGERRWRAPRRSTPAGCASECGYVFDHATPIGEIVVASPTYYRFDATFHGRPPTRASAPRTAAARSSRPRRRSPRCRSGAWTSETTANVGTIEGGVGAHEHGPRAAAGHWPRPARSTTRGRGRGRRDRRPPPRRRERPLPSASRRRRRRGALRRLPPTARGAGRRRRRGARCARCGYTPRRIATGGASDANAFAAGGLPVVNLANGTERNHQPDERVSVAGARGHARRRARAARAAAEAGPRLSRASSASAARPSTRADLRRRRARPLPPRRRRGGRARDRRAPGRGGRSSPTTTSTSGSCASRARRSARPTSSRSRPAGWTSRARRPRDGQARAGRGDRQGGRRAGRTLTTYYTSAGFTDEQVHVYLATGLRDATRPRPTRTSASRSSAGRWRTSTARIDASRDAKTLIGLLSCCAPRAARRRLTAALQRAGGGGASATNPRGHGRRRPSRRPARSSTSCSTSSPTSSSSAGCRATRSRPTGPTCCSSART